jgi:hypothetical protein
MNAPSLIDIPALHATGPAPNCSERYEFYPTSRLIEPLLEDRWEITQAFQVGRKRNTSPYAKHLVRLTHPKLQFGEERLEAIIRNSHNASSKLEMMLGAWRFICSNGIMVGSSFADFAISHTRPYELVQERAQEIIETAPQVVEVFGEWKSRQTSEDERHAFAIAAAFIRFGEKPPIDPNKLLVIRRFEDQGQDLWSVYQRIQENVIKGGLTREDGRRTTRGIRAIDETVRINKALWRAAEALGGAASDLALPA